jgi:hypothetical protein
MLVSEARGIGRQCGAEIVEHDIGRRLPDLT